MPTAMNKNPKAAACLASLIRSHSHPKKNRPRMLTMPMAPREDAAATLSIC